MKFPGKRKSKHYFPVSARDPLLQQIQPENESNVSWVVGIDQTLVDIEAKVDEAFIVRYGLSAGHSLVIEDDVAEALYQELVRDGLITHQFAGGTIGNTMHNYSVLADDRSVLLGVMCSNIEIGGYAYRYLCNTSSRTWRHLADVWRRAALFAERSHGGKVDSHSRSHRPDSRGDAARDGALFPARLVADDRHRFWPVSFHRQYRGAAARAGGTAAY